MKPHGSLKMCPECGTLADAIVPTSQGDAFQCPLCMMRWYYLPHHGEQIRYILFPGES